ncbi:hypothetical protein AAG565_05320 [Fontimonas sp. SYSU GA230001]
MKTRPSLELVLLIVLPLVAVLASVVTLTLAGDAGFTPLPDAERIIGTR